MEEKERNDWCVVTRSRKQQVRRGGEGIVEREREGEEKKKRGEIGHRSV